MQRELWLLQVDLAALQVGRVLECSGWTIPVGLAYEARHAVGCGLLAAGRHPSCRLSPGPVCPLLQAAERLGSVQQEVAILRHAAAMPEEERQRQGEARQAAGPPPDLLRQLHAAAGSLSSAAVQRQRLTDGVFRPSHVLPTMSVEQFGELEYARCALL